MSEIIGQPRPDKEILESREIPRNLSEVEDVVSEIDLQHFFEALYRNYNDQATTSAEANKRQAAITAKKAKQKLEETSGKKYYYAISDTDSVETVATGFLDIVEPDKGQSQGWIKFLTVNSELRGRGLAAKIKSRIEKTARDKGCDRLNCTVLADNPLGLEVELKDEFIFTDFFSEHGGFKFFGYKRLDGVEDADRKKGPLGEMKEVAMSDTSALKKMVDQDAKEKWAVIDIKNLGDKKNNDPDNWILILEKMT